MIIQCDHCSAKFKMDDSKLANGPVKVRCAKCKEVFIVRQVEPVEEETVAPSVVVPPPAPAPENDAAGFDFGDTGFSFDQESPPAKVSPPAEQADSNEFDWQSSTPDFDTSPDTSSGKTEFDLSAFESSIESPQAAVPAHGEIPDSNDFNFDDMGEQESSSKSAEPAAAASQDDFSLDFGDVSFGESPSSPQVASGSSANTSDDMFAIPAEPPPMVAESSSMDDFVLSFNADSSAQESPQDAKAEGMEGVNFGDFSFGDMEPPAVSATSNVKPDETDYGKAAMATPSASGFLSAEDDELPPSSLSSRKKSGSQFPLQVIIGAIVLVIALAGFGVYFFSGPKAFSSVGLGFLVDWYGDKGGEEGSISLKNVTAGYTTNRTAGELFVVRGEAVNNYKKPRASIQVKVTVVGPSGAALVSKSAFTGNSLSAEQLNTLPMAKIEEIMNNQFGDSLANLGLKPGSSIPFVVVIGSVPKESTDYTVQVSGSTVATQ